MEFSELSHYSHDDFEALSVLLKSLNDNIVLTETALDNMLNDGNCHLYVLRDGQQLLPDGNGRIVACASLCLFYQPFQTDATVEAVVVAADYRGRGLGEKIVRHVIDEAGKLGVRQLHLTSSPFRIAANVLYPKLGFVRKDTNCYVMNL